MTGRQLARVSAVQCRETIHSELYPGNYNTVGCFQPTVLKVERSLELSEGQKKQVVWRFDSGVGSDGNYKWLLERGYQALGKGYSGKRAVAWAKHVKRWEKYDEKCWLGDIEPLVDYGCPIKVFIRRRLTKKGYHYSYYATTLKTLSKRRLMYLYNKRGGAEVEQFRGDKGGLHLETRQKGKFLAQEGIILLTDIAHNLLGNFYRKALEGSKFDRYGNKRIIRELLAIPGKLIFKSGELRRVELISGHINSREMLKCLKKCCSNQ